MNIKSVGETFETLLDAQAEQKGVGYVLAVFDSNNLEEKENAMDGYFAFNCVNTNQLLGVAGKILDCVETSMIGEGISVATAQITILRIMQTYLLGKENTDNLHDIEDNFLNTCGEWREQ